jgi:hypothetical protein
MTWEGGEEHYNVFRWYRAGWGRYTQSDQAASAHPYSYVGSNPIGAIDPLGLFKVDKSGVKNIPSPQIMSICPGLGSACTFLKAYLKCDCECDGQGGYHANATLVLEGNLYYFPGNPKMLKTKPFDKTVVDPASSIAHEWNFHIHYAIDAVTPAIKQLESQNFASKEDCGIACTWTSLGFVESDFLFALKYTQAAEQKGYKP